MELISKYDLFLFDFDGLLVNTEPLHYQAYINALAKRDKRLSLTLADFFHLAQLHATSWKEAVLAEIPHLKGDWDSLYLEKKKEYLILLQAGKVELMEGVEELLRALNLANTRRCIVTHSPKEQLKSICLQLPILQTIPHWITREDYEKPKPDPECYLKAISLFGKKGDKIIGFEDSLRGLEALSGTSAEPILICSHHHPLLKTALQQERARHFESLKTWLNG